MKSVIIIEDDEDTAFLLQRYFVNMMYLCTVTTNPFRALDLVDRGSFDILLTDISMPIMSGIELIKYVKLLKPKMKIIATSSFILSGMGHDRMDSTALAAGAHAFLPKPITKEGLANTLITLYKNESR